MTVTHCDPLRVLVVEDETLLRYTIRRQWPATPVVVMTAHAAPDALEKMRSLNVRTILTKPFGLDSLPAVLRNTPLSETEGHGTSA